MTTKLLVTLFLLKTSLLFSQKIDFTQVYHPIINDAEMALIDSNYVEALDLYKGAFQNVEKPFAKDFYNAALCAFYADKQSTMFEYLEKLAEKGLPYDSLKKDTFFKLVIDTTAKWKKFEVRYRNVKSLINKDLRDSLVRMNKRLEKDYDGVFKYENKIHFYFDTLRHNRNTLDSVTTIIMQQTNSLKKTVYSGSFFDSKMVDKKLLDSLKALGIIIRPSTFVEADLKAWGKISEENNKSLSKIIDEYGFPDENLVGLSPPFWENFLALNILEDGDYRFWYKDASISRKTNHPTTVRTRSYEISAIVFNAVRQGKMLPKTAQILLRNRSGDEAYHSGKIQVFKIKLEENVKCDDKVFDGKKDKWLWKKEDFGDFTVAQINESRATIGLENLDNCYKKLFYKQKMPFFEINAGWISKEYTYASSCATVEKLIKNAVVVE
jgi:hypothetical protein